MMIRQDKIDEKKTKRIDMSTNKQNNNEEEEAKEVELNGMEIIIVAS